MRQHPLEQVCVVPVARPPAAYCAVRSRLDRAEPNPPLPTESTVSAAAWVGIGLMQRRPPQGSLLRLEGPVMPRLAARTRRSRQAARSRPIPTGKPPSLAAH